MPLRKPSASICATNAKTRFRGCSSTPSYSWRLENEAKYATVYAGKILVCMKELGDHKVIEAEVTKHITVVLTEEQLHTLYEHVCGCTKGQSPMRC